MALTLYFGELKLGEVVETSYDSPGISGTFERSLHWGNSDLWQQLERYIRPPAKVGGGPSRLPLLIEWNE